LRRRISSNSQAERFPKLVIEPPPVNEEVLDAYNKINAITLDCKLGG